MRDCILILEPVSTGENYVFDSVNRGFQPVVIFPKLEGSGENTEIYEKIRAEAVAHFPKETIYLTDTGDYPALLAEIRSYPVVCVAIGSELGAELGDKIASDLGLPGNPPEIPRKVLCCTAIRTGCRNDSGSVTFPISAASSSPR